MTVLKELKRRDGAEGVNEHCIASRPKITETSSGLFNPLTTVSPFNRTATTKQEQLPVYPDL